MLQGKKKTDDIGGLGLSDPQTFCGFPLGGGFNSLWVICQPDP